MSGQDDEELYSRSDLSKRRKAEEKRLAALGSALVGLSAKQLDKLELSEELRDAVDEARRMTAHAARARQLRIVRRELRNCDSTAVAEAVDELVNPRGSPSPALRAAQRWADRLLGEGSEAVESFIAEHAQTDRQRLNTLVRNARKAAGKVDPANDGDDGATAEAKSTALKAAKARKTLIAAVQAWMRQVPPA